VILNQAEGAPTLALDIFLIATLIVNKAVGIISFERGECLVLFDALKMDLDYCKSLKVMESENLSIARYCYSSFCYFSLTCGILLLAETV
jgi:hypothetical protein